VGLEGDSEAPSAIFGKKEKLPPGGEGLYQLWFVDS